MVRKDFTKTINLTEEIWKRLSKDKYEHGLKTHEDVILRLYKIEEEVKNEVKDKQ